ncbi:hypothetical protein BU17DRAFT_65371 [Hysterangium stoloniferum]|nr:hypothetical protein BU17DRAFT_65371 [Hysterangium stoloniferum]
MATINSKLEGGKQEAVDPLVEELEEKGSRAGANVSPLKYNYVAGGGKGGLGVGHCEGEHVVCSEREGKRVVEFEFKLDRGFWGDQKMGEDFEGELAGFCEDGAAAALLADVWSLLRRLMNTFPPHLTSTSAFLFRSEASFTT